MVNKILITVAGRGLCEEMLNMLMDIPSFQQASVTVLHVVPPQFGARGMAERLEEGGKILAKAVETLKVDPSKINPRLKQGDPKMVVLEVADEEDSDLIIMGSRALGRLQSILQNSVSQYVFQLTSRPMLLIKDDIYVKRLNRVLVAVDGSVAATNSLKYVLSWLRDIKGSQLSLLHVNPPSTVTSTDADPVLTAAVAEAKKAGVEARTLLASGRAGEVICQTAEDLNADMVVLGSPDRRPSIAKSLPDLDRLLGDSLSDYVRVHANCPVLLVRGTDS
ncbi:universal stress protein [Trichothermofontia sp.]